jgi:FkbM family methyltransferase
MSENCLLTFSCFHLFFRWGTIARGWEKDSLQSIHYFLSRAGPKSVYIDFGSWIGPTVLYASKYAGQIYSLEPDPGAYRELYHNIHANPSIAAKTYVENLCISDSTKPLTMYGHQGNSMSSLFESNEKDKPTRISWDVQCTTLDKFVESHDIEPASIGLIKVDTEGAEARIFKQLRPWILKHKPTMLLSIHVFQYPDDHEMHAMLQEIIMTYKNLVWPNGESFDRKAFTVGGWCRLCAMILTDLDPPAGKTFQDVIGSIGS